MGSEEDDIKSLNMREAENKFGLVQIERFHEKIL
jgi:hypothetical protein